MPKKKKPEEPKAFPDKTYLTLEPGEGNDPAYHSLYLRKQDVEGIREGRCVATYRLVAVEYVTERSSLDVQPVTENTEEHVRLLDGTPEEA